MNTVTQLLGSALLYILIVIVVFLLLREVNCWYWKVNKRIAQQETTNQLLAQILEKLSERDRGENKIIDNSSPAPTDATTEKISLNEMYRRKRENGDRT